jgi:hypothetical protein
LPKRVGDEPGASLEGRDGVEHGFVFGFLAGFRCWQHAQAGDAQRRLELAQQLGERGRYQSDSSVSSERIRQLSILLPLAYTG